MKLLLDQNLSFKLVCYLHTFADALHTGEAGLSKASDEAVWEYAKAHNYIIVSKDSDFLHRAMFYSAPPKVIWLRIGNASTQDILHCLQNHWKEIMLFEKSPDESVLILPTEFL